MTRSSCSSRSRASASWGTPAYLSANPRSASTRSHESAVWPSGICRLGSAGDALCRSKASSSARLTLRVDGTGVGRQRGRHLVTAAQVGRARQVEPAVEVGEAAAGADGRHRRGQPVLLRGGVVDVAGRDDVEAVHPGQPGEGGVGDVGARARGELDQHVLEPEQRGQPVEGLAAAASLAGGQSLPDRALAAAGQDRPVAAPALAQLVEVVDRAALLVAAQVRVGDRPRPAGGSPRRRAPAPAGGCPRGRVRRSAGR